MKTLTMALRRLHRRPLLLAGLTALLFAALPAQAQLGDTCPTLNDIPEETLDLYLDELEDEFGADQGDDELCSKLTDNFVKACQTAVKDALKCLQNQFKALNQQNQTLCKALAGSGVDACTNYYKNSSKAASEVMKNDAGFRTANCEQNAADEFYDVCYSGF